MGVVYRAVDLDRTEEVALKTLQRLTPSNLLRLKREFRSVADLVHENLVSLRELVSEGSYWFYTMELVDGVNLYAFIRDEAPPPAPLESGVVGKSEASCESMERDADELRTSITRGTAEMRSGVLPRALGAAGLERLRMVFRQVVRAVSALHDARILHRDLKPGNVLVDKLGRAVVLDFGLVGELTPASSGGSFCGTPAYAAPEQMHSPATSASDWYSVGVMLYESLTARLPFRGDPIDVLAMKQSMDPISPAALVGAPADLDALTMALLRRDPSTRPGPAEILARLAETPLSEEAVVNRTTKAHAPSVLVGRDRELSRLFEALGDVRSGVSTMVRVHGGSGIGKTALVRAFCDEIGSRGRAVVLTGRCYERESVPYKALDPIVDALARHIGAMSDASRAKLVESAFPDAGAASAQATLDDLVLAFPVLMGLAPKRPASPAREIVEQQRRAARALGSLLREVSRSEPLILWTDDLQWGDRDSARLLAELLDARGPHGERLAPPLLWIGSYREGTESESPFLQELFALGKGCPTLERPVDLPVSPLGAADARRLAQAHLEAAGADSDDGRVEALAAESSGSPYFIQELAQHLGDAPIRVGATLSIDELIGSRLSSLSSDARRLLEVVAVAGGPVTQRVALAAAHLRKDEHTAIDALRAAQLVRTYGVRPVDPIEPWHDRIRETLYAQLDPENRRARHLAFAEALAASEGADAHRLATHFFLGGRPAEAARNALEAADGAARALAFDRAASLFHLAMTCLPDPTERAALELERRYADALVNSGRCAEAAPLYLVAAQNLEARGAPPAQTRKLRQRAAEQLLVSGRRTEGIQALGPLLRELDLPWPATPRAAMISLVARLLRFEITGTRFRPRSESEIDRRVLERADLCWIAGAGMLSVDTARGGYFMVRSLEEALRSGDRVRAARSLAVFGMMQVYSGKPRSVAKGRKIFDQAEAISASLDNPLLEGTLASCRGTADMSIGEWRRGLAGLERGIEILRSRCVGVAWELSATLSSTFNARLWLGENLEIARRAATWLRDAEAVGDWLSTISAELYTAYGRLSSGSISEAKILAEAPMKRWSRDGEFTYQKWLQIKILVLCDLAEGRVGSALDRLERAWPSLARSGLLGVEVMVQDAHLLRGTVLIAQANAARNASLAARVQKDIKTLERIGRPTARGGADLLSAGVAMLLGNRPAAERLYSQAAHAFRSVDVALLASVADARRGAILGGNEGAELVRRAREHGERERIGDFDGWVRMHAPVG